MLTAVALERLQAGRLRTALIALGACSWSRRTWACSWPGSGSTSLSRARAWCRRQLAVGIALVVAGVAFTVIATYVLIPAFGGRTDYYWAYTALGPTPRRRPGT